MDRQRPQRPQTQYPNQTIVVQRKYSKLQNKATNQVNAETVVQRENRLELDFPKRTVPKSPGTKEPNKPINVNIGREAKVFRLYANAHGESLLEAEYERRGL